MSLKRYSPFSLILLVLVTAYLLYSYFKDDAQISKIIPQNKSPELVSYYIDDYRWDELTDKLRILSDNYKAKVGIYLKDLKTKKTWEYNADRLFRSASLIKLPIMIAVMDAVERGKISLDTELVITNRERMDGSGSLKWARDGTRLSVLEIVYRMVTESDNTATRLLIDRFGVDYFKSYFKQIGLAYTNITLEGMDLTSGRVVKENYTTPREMGYLLEKIYNKEAVSKNMSEMMLDILKRNKSHSRIRKGVPLTWEVGHKTGLLRKSCSDVGIIFSPKGDYIIAVLLDDVVSYRSGKDFIAKIAKATSDFYRI
jgi:beta-lactamase class A